MIAVRHLMSYLASTPELGLVYYKPKSSTLLLEAYCDANWGNDSTVQARSQSGDGFYFAGAFIDWNSKIQPVIAQSSTEAEHVSAFNCSRTVVYFRQFLEELGYPQARPTTLWEDNQACIAQSKNAVNSSKVRHMLLKYHYIRDLVESGFIKLEYIITHDQIADIFTKPLAPKDFLRLRPFIVQSSPIV